MSDDEIEEIGSNSWEIVRQFNWREMNFPSDKITVRRLRELSDTDIPCERPLKLPKVGSFDDLETIMGLERQITQIVFCKTAGVHEHSSKVRYGELDMLKEMLAEDYVRTGIATGEHHAEQMIRDIEAQAMVQVARVTGHKR